MKPERIKNGVFLHRCTDCSAPLFIAEIEIELPDHTPAYCFNCFEDRCEVGTFIGVVHLPTTEDIDNIIDSPLNKMHEWKGPQAIKESIRFYKKKLRVQKTAEAEADIDEIF